jgi:lipopolysaccharide cholinephosphotransferase
MTVVPLSGQDLHRMHQVQLEMLCELDRVCRQLGVNYQLGAGSLLGAVRHAGFIPWDDDVDVVMLRADYRRFLRGAPALLDRRLFLQTWRSDPQFHAGFAKLRRHGSIFREEYRQHLRLHHGIYIDIFPFDSICSSGWWGRLAIEVIVFVRKWVELAGDVRAGRVSPARLTWRRRLVSRGMGWLPSPFWLAMQEALLRPLSLVPSKDVVCLVTGCPSREAIRSQIRPVSEFHQTLNLSFEGLPLPVTRAYHRALSRLYGDYRQLPPPALRTLGHPVVEFQLPEPQSNPPSGSAPPEAPSPTIRSHRSGPEATG